MQARLLGIGVCVISDDKAVLKFWNVLERSWILVKS